MSHLHSAQMAVALACGRIERSRGTEVTMRKRWLKGSAVVLGLLFALFARGVSLRAQATSAVPKLDLTSFTGTWYEIARYANKRQKRCVGDAIDLIAAGDKLNRLLVVNSCRTKSTYPDIRNGKLRAQDKSGDGKLKLRYTWPFSSKFWVLAVGPEYEWALVGSPNHKTLWILSRAAAMKPEVLSDVEARAAAQGFAVAKLVITPQTTPQTERLGGSQAAF